MAEVQTISCIWEWQAASANGRKRLDARSLASERTNARQRRPTPQAAPEDVIDVMSHAATAVSVNNSYFAK